eukprot:scaffold56781_cov18-Prasinocladus_malaysianus.AAC.1
MMGVHISLRLLHLYSTAPHAFPPRHSGSIYVIAATSTGLLFLPAARAPAPRPTPTACKVAGARRTSRSWPSRPPTTPTPTAGSGHPPTSSSTTTMLLTPPIPGP